MGQGQIGPAEYCTILHEIWNDNHNLGTGEFNEKAWKVIAF
jgi:hypothetical protein